jgi:hypothetical protein
MEDMPLVDDRFTMMIELGDPALTRKVRFLEVSVRPGASTGDFTENRRIGSLLPINRV